MKSCHTYLTPSEIDKLQLHEKMIEKSRQENKSGFLEQCMISYRCSCCLNLVYPSEYFCDICEKLLKEGHSKECSQLFRYKNATCICDKHGRVAESG